MAQNKALLGIPAGFLYTKDSYSEAVDSVPLAF